MQAVEKFRAPGRWRVLLRGVLALTLAASVAACGGSRTANEGPSAPRYGRVVPEGTVALGRFGDVRPVAVGQKAKIALLAPVGQQRTQLNYVGRSIANGAQLALSDIGDQSIELRLYDTGGDPGGAALAARAALQDGAHLILGPLISGSVASVAPQALREGVPVIAFSTDGAVAGKNVFLIGFLHSAEAFRIVNYARARGINNFGLLAPENQEGNITLEAFNRAIGTFGGRIQIIERYPSTFDDIGAAAEAYAARHVALNGDGETPEAPTGVDAYDQVGALSRGQSPDAIQAVILADGGQDLNALSSFLQYFDVSPGDVKFIGTGKWNAPIVFTEPSLRGGWFAAPNPTLRAQFTERYEAAFGGKPHALASLGYDAMAAAGAMAQEARRAASQFPFTKTAITSPIGFVGVNGVFRFREDGLNDRGLAVLEVGAESFQVIDRAPTSFGGG